MSRHHNKSELVYPELAASPQVELAKLICQIGLLFNDTVVVCIGVVLESPSAIIVFFLVMLHNRSRCSRCVGGARAAERDDRLSSYLQSAHCAFHREAATETPRF